MKYSSTLLKKFISVDDSPENIANNLTLKSCEIEELIQRKLPQELVIGYVTKAEKHPDADKLTVCQVDCGDKGSYQILCGAKNVGENMFIAAALPGSYLPAIDIKIEARKMRGLESNGMICAKSELGINEDEEIHGIWILTEDLDDISKDDLGTPLVEKYPWLEGFVVDVDNKGLTHRPDLTGHFGMAIELNSIYGEAQKRKNGEAASITYDKISEYFKNFEHTNILEVLKESDNCEKNIVCETDGLRSYILMELKNVEVKKSSFYTRLQLLDISLQPRNNRVDVSNLILFLTGQPVHFFDADKLDGDIIVRNAKAGEKFTDLFGKEHSLLETDLVITDKSKILALAGVVGGENSGVTDETKNVVVEIANFDPVMVRKTGTRLGLRTDAEIRYEKNINPVYSLFALLLILDVLDYYEKDLGEYSNEGLNYYISDEAEKQVQTKKEIEVNFNKLSQFVFGKDDEKFPEIAKNYIRGLGFKIAENKRDGVETVVVPMRRGPGDMNIQEDVYEEITRLYGYDNIAPLPIEDQMWNVNYSAEVYLQRSLESFLVQDGKFDQVETYPWVETKYLDLFGVDKSKLYSLQNAVNPDAPLMRDSLLWNLFAYAARNSKFFDELKMFDIGKVWHKDRDACNQKSLEGISNPEKYVASMVGERMQVGGIIYKKSVDDWKEDSLMQIKALLQTMFDNLERNLEIKYEKTSDSQYHPNKQGKIFVEIGEKSEKVLLGFIGSLHPLILKSLKIPENASLTGFSLFMDEIIRVGKALSENKNYHYESLQDQIVWRDLCFVMGEKESFEGILSAVKAVDGVEELEVFDLYKGENLGDGKKSLSFKFKIVGDGNMTTEQINEIMNKTIAVGEKAGGELRG